MRSPTLLATLLALFFASTALAQNLTESGWQTLPLTDARTGDTFTLGDFEGQTVLVEPMATWCVNCRQQLGNLREARAQLGDEIVFVALSVETNISDAELARYADDAGFEWVFAVMTPELLRALAADLGRAVAAPPATPHFVITPDGEAGELLTGLRSPDELVALLTP